MKTNSFAILLFNSFGAVFCLLCGMLLYFIDEHYLQNVSIQLFLLFCLTIPVFYIASFCFMNHRSIPAQILGDLIKLLQLPNLLQKNRIAAFLYVIISTLLLWIPLLMSIFFENATIFFIGYVLVWITFFRATDYAEQQALLEHKEDDKIENT